MKRFEIQGFQRQLLPRTLWIELNLEKIFKKYQIVRALFCWKTLIWTVGQRVYRFVGPSGCKEIDNTSGSWKYPEGTRRCEWHWQRKTRYLYISETCPLSPPWQFMTTFRLNCAYSKERYRQKRVQAAEIAVWKKEFLSASGLQVVNVSVLPCGSRYRAWCRVSNGQSLSNLDENCRYPCVLRLPRPTAVSDNNKSTRYRRSDDMAMDPSSSNQEPAGAGTLAIISQEVYRIQSTSLWRDSLAASDELYHCDAGGRNRYPMSLRDVPGGTLKFCEGLPTARNWSSVEDINTEPALETFPDSMVHAISVSTFGFWVSHLAQIVVIAKFIARVIIVTTRRVQVHWPCGFDLNKAHFFDFKTENGCKMSYKKIVNNSGMHLVCGLSFLCADKSGSGNSYEFEVSPVDLVLLNVKRRISVIAKSSSTGDPARSKLTRLNIDYIEVYKCWMTSWLE